MTGPWPRRRCTRWAPWWISSNARWQRRGDDVCGIRRMEESLTVVERPPARATGGPAATLVLLHGFGRYHGHLLDLWSTLDVDCSVVAVQASFRIGPAAYRWFA